MSGLSGLSSNYITSSYTGPSSATLQSQIDKLQGQYADCASCSTTPAGEKQNQEAAIGGQIQALKMELSKISSENSTAKLYQLKNSTQDSLQIQSTNSIGSQLDIFA